MGYGAFGPTDYNYTLINAGAIGSTPTPSIDVISEVGNILCFPFTQDLLDVTGNHTIDDGSPALISTEVYNYGAQGLDVNYGVGNSPRILAASQAHQIPHTEPVTFGFFMMARTYIYTLQLMGSGPGANSSNYGIQLQSSAGWRFQGAGVTAMGDHREITPSGRFFHIALAISANRTSSPAAEFYINGHPLWTGTLVNANTVNANDNFSFLCDQDENASDLSNGFMSHCFVSDNLLDRATIRALSDEAFGHASPQWKATV
jgi:hypothetical protein